jgi:8-oxo-dGTP diphosphatase
VKEEVDGVEWFLVSQALKLLSHQNERDAVLKALVGWDMK